MKRKLYSMLLGFLFVLALAAPAWAATAEAGFGAYSLPFTKAESSMEAWGAADAYVTAEAKQEQNTILSTEDETNSAQLDHVTDAAGLLTETEWQSLEQQARDISAEYGFGVYIITVEDYRDYTNGDIFDAAKGIYEEYSLGMGSGRDGLLLLLSMARRDYELMAYGDFGRYAFNDEGRSRMTEFFLDDLAEDEWYDGFADYLSTSADYLEEARNGEPYTYASMPMSSGERNKAIGIRLAIILLVPLAVAGIYVWVLTSKMKNVATAVEASTYVSGKLNLSSSQDHFTHITTSRRKIETSHSGGGSRSSGGASGTSGKF